MARLVVVVVIVVGLIVLSQLSGEAAHDLGSATGAFIKGAWPYLIVLTICGLVLWAVLEGKFRD